MVRCGRREARVIINVEGDVDNDLRKLLSGLRVLVVGDGDPSLARKLCFLSCSVTTCPDQRTGFSTLEENSRQFDLVFANVDQHTGLQFVEFVGQNLGLPIVVMCTSENKTLMKEGRKRGACESLVKPWVDDELKNILWYLLQYQIRSPDGRGKSARRDEESAEASEPHTSENLSKSWRLVWTGELTAKFHGALDLLKDEKVTPKKIIKIMNVPDLTRAHVSSRLQKYRLEQKKKPTPPPDPKDDDNSKSPRDAGSYSNQGMMINEPTLIRTKDAPRFVEPCQMPNLASFLMTNDHILQPPYGGFGVSNEPQGNGLTGLPPYLISYEDSPPRQNLCPVDHQPGQLDWQYMNQWYNTKHEATTVAEQGQGLGTSTDQTDVGMVDGV